MKRILFIIAGAVVLLVIVAWVLFVDVSRYKPRLETAASEALGMDVRIGGRLGVGFFPGFHVTMEDGHIMDEQGVDVANAKRTSLSIDVFSLLRKQFRLRRIELTQPRLFVERDPEGSFNVERLKKAAALLARLEGGSLSISDGSLLYADRRTGEEIEATDFDLDVSRMRLRGGRKGLALKAEMACGEIRTKNFSVSALKVSIDGKDGGFELEPITMKIFGGEAKGSLRADVSGPVPFYQIDCSLPNFRIEEFLRVLSPEKAAEGTMDFTASLSMQGTTASRLVQTAAGQISLRGERLTLIGTDLDGQLSNFQSSQKFNLVDLGAVFLAGPLGLAVTKGYNFAGLFRGSGGNSTIETLVSDWRVERGVAQAKDVAMATTKNRIALQGGIDFVNQQFADVTVAMVDAEGCPRVRQTIRGSFEKPTVEKPSVITSLAGPVLKLYSQTRGLFPAGPCEVFYSGLVAPPR